MLIARRKQRWTSKRAPPRSAAQNLIRRRPFNMIDDEHLNGRAFRFKFESELFLQRREQRWTIRIDRRVAALPAEVGPGGILSGVNVRSMSKFPVRPVRSTTMRWVNCDSICVNCASGTPPAIT